MGEFIKELDYSIIQKSSEKYKNINEAVIHLEVEGEQVPFKVEVYKVFSPVSIKECVVELVQKIDSAKKVDRDGFGDILTPYVMFLCVKHFTTLELPEKFAEQVLAIENMLNTGALMQIYLHLDEGQLELVKEEIDRTLEVFNNNRALVDKLKVESVDKVFDKQLMEF